jgi:hypothetical protein
VDGRKDKALAGFDSEDRARANEEVEKIQGNLNKMCLGCGTRKETLTRAVFMLCPTYSSTLKMETSVKIYQTTCYIPEYSNRHLLYCLNPITCYN